MRKGSLNERHAVAPPTPEASIAPMPPILPLKQEWRAAVLEAAES